MIRTTAQARGRGTRPVFFRSCLAMASAAAGVIHLAAAPDHFGLSALHGWFFLLAGVFQLVAAALLVRPDPAFAGGRALLLRVTAAGNLGLVGLWVMSRTTGVPVGPGAWTPEPAGLADVTCCILEVLVATGAVALLTPQGRAVLEGFRPVRSGTVLAGAAASLVLLSGFSVAVMGSSGHSHADGHAHAAGAHHHDGAVHPGGAHAHDPAAPAHADGHGHADGHTHAGVAAAQPAHAGGHAHVPGASPAHPHTGPGHGAQAVPGHADGQGTGAHGHPEAAVPSVVTAPPSQAIGPAADDRWSTVLYGPFVLPPKSLGGMLHVSLIQPTLARPCTDCFLTSVTPDLVYGDGRTANLDTGPMLHHAVWARPLVPDATCGGAPVFGLIGERFFASGNERTPWVMPTGFGYRIGGDPWNLITEIMNHSEELRIVFVKLDVTHRPAPDPGIEEVKPLWMDVANCSTSEYAVPAGASESSWSWRSSLTGRVVSAAGHLHDGGTRISLVNESTGTHLCTSAARYGTRPGSLGTLDSMTSCVWDSLGAVRNGDVLGLRSAYETAQPASDVMGIMLVYVHPTDDVGGGMPAHDAVTTPVVGGSPPPAHGHAH